MASVTFKQFGGSVPRLAPHLLSGVAAAVALDCRLHHGTLQSWREPLYVRPVPEGTKTSVLYDCCWLDFQTCVDLAPGPVTCRQLFATGNEEWPAIYEFDADCEPTVKRLGLPCPLTAPSVVTGAGGAPKDTEGRAYAYQYRNADADRSALSRASQAVLIRDGQSVLISGWDVPDASWGVTEVLIYRTVTGYQTGREPGNTLDTVWMLVGTAAIGAPSFTDNLRNDELINAIEEDVATPPPANLRGITAIASMNALVGYVGNQLFFSENNSYHHWPYTLTLDDNICAIVEDNGVLYVATDGHPYVVSAAVDCKNAGCRTAKRLDVPMPMVGCGNRRMAAIPGGAVYPTHDGLAAITAASSMPVLMTEPLYAPDDWHKLHPDTIRPVVAEGQLFVFARNGAFVMDLPGASGGWNLDSHSELSDRDVIDAFVSRTGDFYIVKPTGVFQWNRGRTLRPHRWQSPVLVTPAPVNFGAANLHNQGGAETVTLSVNGRQVLSREVLSPREFRLPNWASGTRWQVTLEGTATVSLFSMATSMKELGA